MPIIIQEILISLAISLGITFSILIVYLVFYKLQRMFKHKLDAYDEATKILNEARMSSLGILRNAHKKALNTLENSSIFNKSLRREVEESVERLVHKHLSSIEDLSKEMEEIYRKTAQTQKERNISTLQDATETMQKEILEGVSDFKETLRQETIETQEMVRAEIKQEYDKLKKELDDYRTDELKKIDEDMMKIVTIAAQKIIGKSLDTDTREDLVIQSLEQAKKEGVFA